MYKLFSVRVMLRERRSSSMHVLKSSCFCCCIVLMHSTCRRMGEILVSQVSTQKMLCYKYIGKLRKILLIYSL